MGIKLGSRATRPYPRPPWLRLRFNLRVVLLAITAVCFGLGLLAYAAQLQRKAGDADEGRELAPSTWLRVE